ncbi:hypothetical protein BGX29_004747 [Mortierella sp. GBA35]|nr:hypothetical protein BGX29_004747 [Mortierella sp. GBA35]
MDPATKTIQMPIALPTITSSRAPVKGNQRTRRSPSNVSHGLPFRLFQESSTRAEAQSLSSTSRGHQHQSRSKTAITAQFEQCEIRTPTLRRASPKAIPVPGRLSILEQMKANLAQQQCLYKDRENLQPPTNGRRTRKPCH